MRRQLRGSSLPPASAPDITRTNPLTMAHWHDPVREAARLAYVEGDETVKEIAQRLGSSEGTIRRWARKYGWPRRGHEGRRYRRKAVSVLARENLIARLYSALSRNLTQLERSMADDEAAAGGGNERSTRALGAIARTMEKLKDVEPGTDPTAAAAPKSGRSASATAELEEAERLRLELADRILKLRERGKP
jgi:transposase-like protein